MEQVEMEYYEIDIWKANEFNFLNEEVEEFTSSQNFLNLIPGYFYYNYNFFYSYQKKFFCKLYLQKEKPFEYCS